MSDNILKDLSRHSLRSNTPREFPEILKEEAQRAFERVKARMSVEELTLFNSRDDFMEVLGLSDFISSALAAYP